MSNLTVQLTGKAKDEYISKRFPKEQPKNQKTKKFKQERIDIDGYSRELGKATKEAFRHIAWLQKSQSNHQTLEHRLADFKGMNVGHTWKRLRLIEGFISGLSKSESTVDIGNLGYMTEWYVKSRMCGGYFRRFYLNGYRKKARLLLKDATHSCDVRDIRDARKALKDLSEVRRLVTIALELEKTERGY
tara:strand:- start:632 stop:1198 length:567 start_codon:yes stop_codon:yes gene_type:complete